MNRNFRQSNISFLCGGFVPGKGRIVTFRIDQFIPRPNDRGARDHIVNQVEAYLHSLSSRTGLLYGVDYWAGPDRMDEYLKVNGIEVD